MTAAKAIHAPIGTLRSTKSDFDEAAASMYSFRLPQNWTVEGLAHATGMSGNRVAIATVLTALPKGLLPLDGQTLTQGINLSFRRWDDRLATR